MDLKDSILYQNFDVNSSAVSSDEVIDGGIVGTTIKNVTYDDVAVQQFLEKKALREGMDAGELLSAGRNLSLTGGVFNGRRARAFDDIQTIRRIFSPRLAYLADKAHQGFLPLSYSVPTDREDFYPATKIELYMNVIPRALRGLIFDRHRTGGRAGDALAIPYQVLLYAKDPRQYAKNPTNMALEGGTALNRGDFPAPLTIALIVGAGPGVVTVVAGGRTLRITVPAGASGRVFTYDGVDGILYVSTAGVVVLSQHLIYTPTLHPEVPVGSSVYTVTGADVVTSGTITFREAYA
jgi:hypothetical protein